MICDEVIYVAHHSTLNITYYTYTTHITHHTPLRHDSLPVLPEVLHKWKPRNKELFHGDSALSSRWLCTVVVHQVIKLSHATLPVGPDLLYSAGQNTATNGALTGGILYRIQNKESLDFLILHVLMPLNIHYLAFCFYTVCLISKNTFFTF